MGTVEDELADMAQQLSLMAEQLADLALDQLRVATDPDEPGAVEAEALERRITRARRAVEKALALLAGPRQSSVDDA